MQRRKKVQRSRRLWLSSFGGVQKYDLFVHKLRRERKKGKSQLKAQMRFQYEGTVQRNKKIESAVELKYLK